MTDGLAVQQEAQVVAQQTVFPGQMPKVAGRVLELSRSNAFGYFQRQLAMRGNYLTGGTGGHGLLSG